ncbi:hypothetical protein BH09PLA1_BH09PLA1_23960 [soil metagenome]
MLQESIALSRRKPASAAIDAWHAALLLIAIATTVRLAYLIWLSPYELVGDEAYYWAQSQHLDWSYDEKGPLLPWCIALCCRLLGNTEWAVRLPVLLASALAAWGIGRLTIAVTNDDRRAGLLAVVVLLLIPAFQANAQICTQDGLLIALLVALTAVGWRLVRRWEADRNTWLEWLAFWALLGVGMLLKQSILLFLASLISYAAFRARALKWRVILIAQQAVGVAVLLVIMGPILFWEHLHHWPMLTHTLGHLGLRASAAASAAKGNAIGWLGMTLGGIVGAAGPPFIVLAIWASIAAYRNRRTTPRDWPAQLWILCAAWPGVLFFVLLSLVKPVVPSWPLPSLVPLVAIVAAMASRILPARRSVRTGQSKSDKYFQAWWTGLIAYGIGGAVLIMFPTVLARLPLVGRNFEKSVVSRIHGSRDEAQSLLAIAKTIATPGARPPVIVTLHYMKASLYSFYAPDRDGITITTSGGYLGSRPNNFDNWDDTRMSNPAMHGRSLLLVGGELERMRDQLIAGDVQRYDVERNLYLATNYQGRRERPAKE